MFDDELDGMVQVARDWRDAQPDDETEDDSPIVVIPPDDDALEAEHDWLLTYIDELEELDDRLQFLFGKAKQHVEGVD